MQPSDELKRRGSIEFIQGILEECWDDGAEAAATALVDRHAIADRARNAPDSDGTAEPVAWRWRTDADV